MTVVKGSKEYHWQVIKTRPYGRLKRTLGFGLSFLACVVLAYFVGQQQILTGYGSVQVALSATKAQLEEVKESEQQMRQAKENATTGAEVDRRSLDELRQEVMDLKQVIAQLQEENQFYRKLVSPNDPQNGLAIGSVEIVKTPEPRNFHYKAVIQQLGSDQPITGQLKFKVLGKRSGQETSLSLSQLSDGEKVDSLTFNLKYFQTLEGNLRLPEGFDAESLELEAVIKGKESASTNKRFAWPVEPSLDQQPR
jgi:hypothetical protein